jgi:hypothetical protein
MRSRVNTNAYGERDRDLLADFSWRPQRFIARPPTQSGAFSHPTIYEHKNRSQECIDRFGALFGRAVHARPCVPVPAPVAHLGCEVALRVCLMKPHGLKMRLRFPANCRAASVCGREAGKWSVGGEECIAQRSWSATTRTEPQTEVVAHAII